MNIVTEVRSPDGASTRATDTRDTPGDTSGGVPDAGANDSGGRGRFFKRLIPRPPGRDGDGIDLRNTWQVLAGSILVPLGVVLILIAWYGAAHTPYVQQQIPYLVSGSFAGLGCMILGGLFYWAHWLYRLYDQADQHHDEQLQAMQQTIRAIAERIPSGQSNGWSSPPAAAQHSPAAGAAHDPTYVVTSTGSVFHAPSCPVVAHHTEGLRVLGPGEVSSMEACRICLPYEQGG